MRRTRFRLGNLLVAAAVVVPAVITGTVQRSAAADSGSLVVTALNREGAPAPGDFDVLDLATHKPLPWWWSGGEPLALKPGRYAVSGVLSEYAGGFTLAGQIITVTAGATTSVTFDARLGQPLQIGLDTPVSGDYQQSLVTRMCLDGVTTDYRTEQRTSGDRLYVLPSTDPRIRVGYAADWTSPTQRDAFTLAGSTPADGRPVTVARSSLGAVDIAVMRGPDSLVVPEAVRGSLQGEGCQQGLPPQAPELPLPFERVYHLNAGTWEFAAGRWSAIRTVAAGSASGLDFGHAVWGPVRYLPWLQHGRLGYFTSGMVADPSVDGVEQYVNVNATLYRNDRVVAYQPHLGNYAATSIRTFWGPVSTSATYTLKVHGTRHALGVQYPQGMMSSATDVSFRFHAGPASRAVAPGLLTRFLPSGLDLYNRASYTAPATIALRLDRTATQPGIPLWPSTASKVEVFGSIDGGQVWSPLAVSHHGTAWSARLPVQVRGSSVSLSSRVTDTAGNTTVTTVYRALTVR